MLLKKWIEIPQTQYGNLEAATTALLQSFNCTNQIPEYSGPWGPNSNTFLHQILINAGIIIVPTPPDAFGWDSPGYGSEFVFWGWFYKYSSTGKLRGHPELSSNFPLNYISSVVACFGG